MISDVGNTMIERGERLIASAVVSIMDMRC